jgi:deaminated glutathione amidase
MNAALVQHKSTPDKAANLERAISSIERAAGMGCGLVILPETDSATPQEVTPAEVAEPLSGHYVSSLRETARTHRITVVSGVLETIPNEPFRASNTAVYIREDGELIGVYRKNHLYDAFGGGESKLFVPGTEPTRAFDAGWAKVGLMVCYDLRFPEVARKLALEGATVVIAPSAWVVGPLKEEHWMLLTRARALENTVYVLAANMTGGKHTGRSVGIDPMGVVIADAGEIEGITVVQIDPDRVKTVREKLPALEHRRTDLY